MGCSSCGGGEVIYDQPMDGGSVVPMQESVPAEGIVVPNVQETQGEILPGGSATKAPVVRPEAFVIRAAH